MEAMNYEVTQKTKQSMERTTIRLAACLAAGVKVWEECQKEKEEAKEDGISGI